MRTIYAIVLFAFLLGIAGCTENEMIEYENDPAVYFAGGGDYYNKNDSIHVAHSFFLYPSSENIAVLLLKINTMGKLEPVKRPFAVVQSNAGEPGAAILGVHYLPFDDPRIAAIVDSVGFRDGPYRDSRIIGSDEIMNIKPNWYFGWVAIGFLRDPSLDLETVRLELEVTENEYFRPGINTHRKFVLTTTAQAVKPKNWDTFWKNYFGPTWGSVKMRFIIDNTGFTEFDQQPADVYFTTYLRTTVVARLAEYNEDHPDDPLREANGDLVTFDF